MKNDIDIKPEELSSRKLWQLVQEADHRSVSEQQLADVIAELARRRNYLSELRRLGKLDRVH